MHADGRGPGTWALAFLSVTSGFAVLGLGRPLGRPREPMSGSTLSSSIDQGAGLGRLIEGAAGRAPRARRRRSPIWSTNSRRTSASSPGNPDGTYVQASQLVGFEALATSGSIREPSVDKTGRPEVERPIGSASVASNAAAMDDVDRARVSRPKPLGMMQPAKQAIADESVAASPPLTRARSSSTTPRSSSSAMAWSRPSTAGTTTRGSTSRGRRSSC